MSRPLRARLRVHLSLGRVSNLPTVWTNVTAGALLAGATPSAATLVPLALALSCFYVGGMYLNDAFDRELDARERPERPIPAGLVSAARVFAIGYGLLALGTLGVALVAPRPAPLGAAVALAAAIVLYDAWHKGNPASPLLMGLCRVLVYVTAALAATVSDGSEGGLAALTRPVLVGAGCLLAYLIGLTYVAKHENKPLVARTWPLAGLAAPLVVVAATSPAALREPLVALAFAALLTWIIRSIFVLRGSAPRRIPRAVTSLIAGISLVDALLLAQAGAAAPIVALAFAGWLLTLAGQRYVSGT